MSSKDKANDLVNKINLKLPIKTIPLPANRIGEIRCDVDLNDLSNAISIAIVFVDEILDSFSENIDFWNEVKVELLKMKK